MLCKHCTQHEVELVQAGEPYNPAFWQCPGCDSTYPYSEYREIVNVGTPGHIDHGAIRNRGTIAYTTCPICGCETAGSTEMAVNKKLKIVSETLKEYKQAMSDAGVMAGLCEEGEQLQPHHLKTK